MRLAPKESTLKRLFALSGNQCAFPGCAQPLVDNDGHLTGQVCHIEAAEPGGERYNPAQSDEDRREFENLLLLCANHHIVTNDVAEFPVESLQKMKADHEGIRRAVEYDVPDEVIAKIIEAARPQQIVTNAPGGLQVVVQNGSIDLRSGVGATEVVSIFRELYQANLPHLERVAAEEVRKRIDELMSMFFKAGEKAKITEQQFGAFAEPDVQAAAVDAMKAAARSNSSEVRGTLADLLVKRLQSGGADVRAKAFSCAVGTIEKLTARQLRILGLAFLAGKTSFIGIKTWDDLRGRFEAYTPFLGARIAAQDLEHLVYAGCGSLNWLLAGNILESWKLDYPALSTRAVAPGEMEKLDPDVRALLEDPRISSSSPGGRIMLIPGGSAEKVLSSLGFPVETIAKYSNLLSARYDPGFDQRLRDMIPNAALILEKWKNEGLRAFALTSVGSAIGLSVCEAVAGLSLDVETWFPSDRV